MQLSPKQRAWLTMQKRFESEQPTMSTLLSLSAVAMVTPAIAITIGIAILAALEILNLYLAMLVFGIGVGALLRDFGRLRLAAHIWPVVQHVTDWQKVDDLLAESSASNKSAAPHRS